MKIDNFFDRIWYVHTANGKKFNSMWTRRREARDQKKALMAQGEQEVKISFVPVSYGTIERDLHS